MTTATPQTKPRARRGNDARRATNDPLPTKRERPGAGDPYADEDPRSYLRAQGRSRRIRRGLIPQSRFGRIAAGAGLFVFLAGVAAAAYFTLHFLHHDPQFTIPSSAAIELRGNQHLSRSQLLSVFGEDVDRNLFDVPMAERQEQLEQIPWVAHATIMRLLPNRLRVQVVERTPIAFVRQGGSIGMADASGVLLDIPPDAPGNPNYSFPVVTGLKATDTPASREQRMHLYAMFLKDMDAGGRKLSVELSEVDLSEPEDVKVLLPNNNVETLVHFGTENFLARYNRFQEHIAEWRQQYPRLGSVDMRYERQVVLQMPPKDSTITPPGNGGKIAVPTNMVTSGKPSHPTAGNVPPQTASLTKPTLAFPNVTGSPTLRRTVSGANPGTTATPTGKTATKQADVTKRVEAIKAWMAKRQAARDAAKAQATDQ